MDTDAIRWFQQVADGVTVTQVAETERVTQSGVSRALSRLETQVGAQLLRRTGRTLRMTPAGAAFKHHVDAMLHQLDDGLAAVNQLVDPQTGTVTLTFQASLGTWLVPDLIGTFRAAHPGVRFRLTPKRDELGTSVRSRGEIDLEISTLRPTDGGVRWHPLGHEPLRLAVPADHPLQGGTPITLTEAATSPFIAIRVTSQLHRLFGDLCAQAGFTPDIAFVADDLPTVLGFVAGGLGVAVVPAPRVASPDATPRRLRFLTLTDPGARREIGLAWSGDRRLLPAARLFRQHVIERATADLLPPLLPEPAGP